MATTEKYRIDTDQGSYEVEVDVPEPAAPPPGRGMSGPEAALAGAKGFAKEAIPATVKAVTDLPMMVVDLIKELGATAMGAYHLSTDPVGTLTNAKAALGGMPAKAKELLHSAIKLAQDDPEGFGRAVADITAQAELGIATSKLVPLAPRPIARGIGTVMEGVGTRGAWPLRIMGAHQLGSGNPAGLATILMPEALKKGGEELIKFGEAEKVPIPSRLAGTDKTATATTTRGSLRVSPPKDAVFHKEVETALNKTLAKVPNKAKEGLQDVEAAAVSAKKDADAIRKASAARETELGGAEARADYEQRQTEARVAAKTAKEVADKKKADLIVAERSGMEPGKKSFSTSVSATDPETGGTQSMRQSFKEPGTGDALQTEYESIKAQYGEGAADLWLVQQNKVPISAPGRVGGGGGGVRVTPPATPRAVAPAPPISVEAPAPRAWSPETAPIEEPIGLGPREPSRLVLSPGEAQSEEQLLRAFRPGAQVQGMKAAARVPRGTLEKALSESGLSEIEKQRIRQLVFENKGTP